jgi:hypothetical protein
MARRRDGPTRRKERTLLRLRIVQTALAALATALTIWQAF